MNIFKRAKMVFSKTAFEQYLSDFATGADLPSTIGGKISEDTALKYSAFFGCARVLSETFASVSINEFKKEGSKGDKKKTNNTGLLPILKFAPNDETSSFNFFEAMMYQIVLGGNFYAERIMNGDKIAGLLQADYSNVEVRRDRTDRKLKYTFKVDGRDVTLDRNQVLHIPGPSTNGIIGMSALQYASSSIQLGITYEQFGQTFYKNGAAPSGVFTHPQSLKDESYNRLVKKIKTDWRGLLNVGKPILAEDGLTFKEITIKPIDAELLSSKRFQIEDVCRFMRVPPHLVQHLEKSTFNNIEQQALEFLMYTMLPYFKRVEHNINFQLLTPRQQLSGYFFEFNIASLLRGDQKAMAEAFAKGRQWGWLSVNDIRRMLNLNSVEGGDTYLQPLNMVSIDEEDNDDSNALPQPTPAPARSANNNGINREIDNLIGAAKL